MHINEHILLAVQITFYRYETCISIPQAADLAKEEGFFEFVFVSMYLTPEGLPKNPQGLSLQTEPAVKSEETEVYGSKVPPPQSAKTPPSAIAGHEMTELRLRFRDDPLS